MNRVLTPSNLGSGHAIDLLSQKAIVPSADVWRKQSDNSQAGADSDAIQHTGNVALKQNLAVRSGGDMATVCGALRTKLQGLGLDVAKLDGMLDSCDTALLVNDAMITHHGAAGV